MLGRAHAHGSRHRSAIDARRSARRRRRTGARAAGVGGRAAHAHARVPWIRAGHDRIRLGFNDVISAYRIVLDPSRVAAQVVSGIGFLGAGTILFLRQQVIRGLTTAASLWTIAAVGLAVGGGMYVAAVATTV